MTGKFLKILVLIVFLAASAIFVGAGLFFHYQPYSAVNCEKAVKEEAPEFANLPVISKEELAQNNGVAKPTVYIGFDCLVYDVTVAKNTYYGPGKGYHFLVGRDSTKQLLIFGGSIIRRKYPVVGILGD